MKSPFLALLLLAVVAFPAMAQVQGGAIYGTVKDEQGGVLPGALVTLTGSDRTTTQTTGTDGAFRFLNLPPGKYSVKVALPGFSNAVNDNVDVRVGANVELPIALKVASVEQSVTVTAESPIVDTKATGTATNFTQSELATIPTSRDPWALLRTVPGVMVDRVNIAGNETGQQSNFQSKGTRPQDAVWTLDGVVVTDMSAVGASPTYFNYDNFDEIQVATSGQDIRQPTGGVGLNFVVKRGTNQYKGTARGYFTNHRLEGTNIPSELLNATRPVTPATADHNQQIDDYGFDLGGPIARDHAWAYGSVSNQDVRLFRRTTSQIDQTILRNYDVKGTWQASKSNLVNVLWFLGDKQKNGRSPGAAGIVFDAPTATWNQADAFVKGTPHGLLKIEDNHTFGESLFVTAKYAYYNTGFGLVPIGGLDVQAGRSPLLQRSFGSNQEELFTRPQHTAGVDGNYFHNIGGAGNQIKFGGAWRRADASTLSIWPGNSILALENSASDFRGRVYRNADGTDRALYFNVYAGDTITVGRATIDAGVRYDRQWGRSLPATIAGNPAFPNLVPGVDFAGYRTPFTWKNVSPRAGLTYALGESKRTVARASYSRYAGQLENGIVGYSNITTSNGFADFRWVDANGDHFVQPNEIVTTSSPLAFGGGFNPSNPNAATSVNVIDPNLKAPVTSSFVAGIDRELAPNLGLSVDYSYTRTNDFNGTFSTFYTPWVGLTAADYLPGPAITGVVPGTSIGYDIPTFLPNPAVVAANGNSRMLTNWPGYYSYYHGVEASLVKRMSSHWMARVSAAYNNAREHYGTAVDEAGNPTRTDTAPLVSGGPFVVRSGGSGSGDIFINAKWQLNANGAYMFPGDLLVGANLFGREGYPFPVYRAAGTATGLDSGIVSRILVTPEIDTLRLPNLWDMDLRASKTFHLGRTSVEAIADLFNVFNRNTALVRGRNAGSSSYDVLAQNLSPRIVRFGVRVGF